MIRHLDLFSGIGGFALAARMAGGIETVGFCEFDSWCQQIIAKNFPNVPIHGDVKTLNPANYDSIELITGGYPCQPFSFAGKRKGTKDDRHLWPEVFRIVKALRPTWVLCENVVGHISMGLDSVLTDLESESYTCQPIIIPACAVGAKHRRDRVWILAHTDRPQRKGRGLSGRVHPQESDPSSGSNGGSSCPVLADSPSERQPKQGEHRESFDSEEDRNRQAGKPFIGGIGSVWAAEPAVGRVAYGIPRRMDRLKGLGNAIVPQVAAQILRAIVAADNTNPTPSTK